LEINMTYTKTVWSDELLAGDERYNIKTDAGADIETNVQIELATGVTSAGTAVNATRLNNIEAGIERLFQAGLLADSTNVEDISTTRALLDADEIIQRLTPLTADRAVTFPTPATTNHPFLIVNASDTYSLTMPTGYDDIAPETSALFISDGVAWHVVSGTGGGDPSDFWTGLQLSRASSSSITIGTGAAYVDGEILSVETAITISSITAIDGLYHIYLYDNSGTVAAEASTTAPAAPYFGLARAKTGDTTRRYLGSVLCIAATGLVRFVHAPEAGLMMYTNHSAPRRVLAGGTGTVKTAISVASVVPITANIAQIIAINTHATETLRIVDDGDDAFLIVPGSSRAAAGAPLDGSNLYYRMSAAVPNAFVDVIGYNFGR
jgi:hypothetical protein